MQDVPATSEMFIVHGIPHLLPRTLQVLATRRESLGLSRHERDRVHNFINFEGNGVERTSVIEDADLSGTVTRRAIENLSVTKSRESATRLSL